MRRNFRSLRNSPCMHKTRASHEANALFSSRHISIYNEAIQIPSPPVILITITLQYLQLRERCCNLSAHMLNCIELPNKWKTSEAGNLTFELQEVYILPTPIDFPIFGMLYFGGNVAVL